MRLMRSRTHVFSQTIDKLVSTRHNPDLTFSIMFPIQLNLMQFFSTQSYDAQLHFTAHRDSVAPLRPLSIRVLHSPPTATPLILSANFPSQEPAAVSVACDSFAHTSQVTRAQREGQRLAGLSRQSAEPLWVGRRLARSHLCTKPTPFLLSDALPADRCGLVPTLSLELMTNWSPCD